jgi:hypothetical protein
MRVTVLARARMVVRVLGFSDREWFRLAKAEEVTVSAGVRVTMNARPVAVPSACT